MPRLRVAVKLLKAWPWQYLGTVQKSWHCCRLTAAPDFRAKEEAGFLKK